ncbi:hypothetical protein WN944_009509 [Citrus x changshan-huyou]|uniref:Disease resistance R13L4/SHOC-2-like LRR domain-containing protein n=1 Tax=Citrus x changshan-huyou TaxID=2935761 RepID=A0AAP0QZV4_9ROSI
MAIALYSDSALDLTTTCCFFVLHEINFHPNEKAELHSHLRGYSKFKNAILSVTSCSFSDFRGQKARTLRFKLLRVLHFEGVVSNVLNSAGRCCNLPKEMVKLINLKYLRLTNAHIDGIPSFIAKLQRLQTLDVFGSMGFIELPGEICELKELRHLIGDFDGNLNIETLSNLRTLKYPLSDCSCLVELRLSGKLEKLPEDLHEVLPNLECLSLKKSGLKEDPMPSVREVAEPHDP